MTLQQTYAKIAKQAGELYPDDIANIAKCERLTQLLIVWHEGRAMVSAQDAQGFIDLGNKGGWCIRGVWLPSGRMSLTPT